MVQTKVVRRKVARRKIVGNSKKVAKKTTAKKKTDVNKKADIVTKTINGQEITFDFTALMKSLKTGCDCRSYYGMNGQGPSSVEDRTCVQVGRKILAAFDAGIDVNPRYVEKYIKFVMQGSPRNQSRYRAYNRYRYTCFANPSAKDTNVEIMKQLMIHYVPDKKTWNLFLVNKEYLPILYNIKNNVKFKGFEEQIAIDLLYGDSCNVCNVNSTLHNDHSEISFVLDNTIMTNNLIDKMLRYKCKKMYKRIKKMLDCTDYDKFITINSLYSACFCLPDSSSIVESIVKKTGFQIDSKCLEIVCEFCSDDAVTYILNYKIQIEKVHFTKACDYLRKGRKNKSESNRLEILFKYGYKMDYDDILYTIRQKLTIDDIERFGVKLDDGIYDQCNKTRFYPDYKFEFKNEAKMQLQRLCNFSNLTKIKAHMDTHNIKPDNQCLINACKKSGNYEVIMFLLESGPPDIMDSKFANCIFEKLLLSNYRLRRSKPVLKSILNKIAKRLDNVNGDDNNKDETDASDSIDLIDGSKETDDSCRSFDEDSEYSDRYDDDSETNGKTLKDIDGLDDNDVDELIDSAGR